MKNAATAARVIKATFSDGWPRPPIGPCCCFARRGGWRTGRSQTAFTSRKATSFLRVDAHAAALADEGVTIRASAAADRAMGAIGTGAANATLDTRRLAVRTEPITDVLMYPSCPR